MKKILEIIIFVLIMLVLIKLFNINYTNGVNECIENGGSITFCESELSR